MVKACALVGARFPTIRVEVGRHNYEAQAEYTKRGFLVDPFPQPDTVFMWRNLKKCVRSG